MARWAGKIGFGTQAETTIDGQPSGIWEDTIVEKPYKGDLIKAHRNTNNSNQINDGITINNQISFVMDAYAKQHFEKIRYATYMGSKWKITGFEIEYPRIVLTLGGVYNGK